MMYSDSPPSPTRAFVGPLTYAPSAAEMPKPPLENALEKSRLRVKKTIADMLMKAFKSEEE